VPKTEPTGKHTLILCPSADLPGVWVAHFLEIDVLTQGEGVEGCLEAAVDAFKLMNAHSPTTLVGSPDHRCCPQCEPKKDDSE